MTQLHPPELGAGLLRFLESLGQRSEAELYLRIFRDLPRKEFALLVPTRAVLRWHAGTLAEQLRFLCDLGLYPTVVLGGIDEHDEEAETHFFAALFESGLKPTTIDAEQLLREPDTEGAPLVVRLHGAPRDGLTELAVTLSPHKTLFLRTVGGLGPHAPGTMEIGPGHMLQNTKAGIGAINLRSDADELTQLLSDEDAKLLELSRSILEGPVGKRARATVSVASPLSILRELFTVSGEGTLIKRGAAIDSYVGWSDVDVERIGQLLEKSFGRSVLPGLFERTPTGVHLERDYRGMALVEEGIEAAFLSKFAVLPVARGEGLGQDLWWRLWKSTPAFYWRSRPDNPINAWYGAACDGMHKTDRWTVYWRGVSATNLQSVIDDAINRPEDFASASV